MGCLSLHLLTACSFGSSKIKVMTVNGRCLKFEAPIIVKEVLMDFPLHALFHSETVRTLGIRARPLHRTLSLQPGHLYFLVPQPSRSHSTRAGASSPALLQPDLAAPLPHTNLVPARTQVVNGSVARRARKVSFNCTTPETSTEISHSAELSVASIESLQSAGSMDSSTSATSVRKSSVQFLPSPGEGVLRVKMVVSKRQLASVLKEGGDCVSMVEGLLSPLLREAEASTSDIARSLSWRPSLESIPESSCPLQRASKDAK